MNPRKLMSRLLKIDTSLRSVSNLKKKSAKLENLDYITRLLNKNTKVKLNYDIKLENREFAEFLYSKFRTLNFKEHQNFYRDFILKNILLDKNLQRNQVTLLAHNLKQLSKKEVLELKKKDVNFNVFFKKNNLKNKNLLNYYYDTLFILLTTNKYTSFRKYKFDLDIFNTFKKYIEFYNKDSKNINRAFIHILYFTKTLKEAGFEPFMINLIFKEELHSHKYNKNKLIVDLTFLKSKYEFKVDELEMIYNSYNNGELSKNEFINNLKNHRKKLYDEIFEKYK